MKKIASQKENPLDALEQSPDAREVAESERGLLIVSMRRIDKSWVNLSLYKDDLWWLVGSTTNTIKADTKIDFKKIPLPFVEVSKAMVYRLIRRGRSGHKKMGPSSIHEFSIQLALFLNYLLSCQVSSLLQASPFVCRNYVAASRVSYDGGAISTSTWFNRLSVVEAIYELSQYTDTPMPMHPWPDSSAHLLSVGKGRRGDRKKTHLMSDDEFVRLFQSAWEIISGADRMLDIRDELSRIDVMSEIFSKTTKNVRKEKRLVELGYTNGLSKFSSGILAVRTAAYIVIASVSGCRNHELAYVLKNAWFCTEDDDGEIYWWLRSESRKTGVGHTEWMIPESAVVALKIMDRWAEPYQAKLRAELESRRLINPLDVEIGEAAEHLDAIFVGTDKAKKMQVRTISNKRWNILLKDFANYCGLVIELSSHMFRRKFANYAARSKFGDLRYLKEHFKHWSMNMTLGYALNESQELALFCEIQDELDDVKQAFVSQWLSLSSPLAGGYGLSIMEWRSREEAVVLFKSRAHMVKSIADSTAIRSNGHAWCTADDDLCIGNSLDRTRCGDGCSNAVVGVQHARIYQGLVDDLIKLSDCKDIGVGGRARVQRDLDRCVSLLKTLGFAPGKVER